MRVKKLKNKKNKKLTLEEEMSILKVRNFIYRTSGDYTTKLVCNDRISEFKGETSLNGIVQHIQMTGIILNDTSILNGLRTMNLDSLVKILSVTRNKNKDKIKGLFFKIQEQRNQVYERESFFCYKLGEFKKEQEGNFDNVIQPADVLYNLKSYFPIERKYLDQLELKLRSKNASNMTKCSEASRKTHHKGDTILLKHDDIVCQVCNSGDYNEKNLIVYCSMCNVSTHQLCYGIQKVPKEDWLCDLCIRLGPNGKYLRCWMCNCRGGVIKETSTPIDSDFLKKNHTYAEFLRSKPITMDSYIKDLKQLTYPVQLVYDFYKETFKFPEDELKNEPVPKNVWVHLSCALWTNELKVKDTDIKNLNKLAPYRFSKICTVCNHLGGHCINCSYDGCNISFHVECGRRIKLFMEIIGVCDPRFIMYCPSHTPLMLKIYIHEYERRAREDIYKYHRYIKRFLKINKINIEELEFKEKIPIVEKEEVVKAKKPKKLELEEMIKYLDSESQLFIREVRRELFKLKDYSSVIDLKMNEKGEYRVDKVSFPKKNIFKGKIASSSVVWKNLAKKYNKTTKSISNKFLRIVSTLKSYEFSPQLYGEAQPDTKSEGKIDDALFEPNNENFDDQIYCICKKEWKGELMIECDRCAKWYHPQCISVNITNEVEINNNHILCNKCTDEYTKDYGINIEIINNDGNSTQFKFRKNSAHWENPNTGQNNMDLEDSESDISTSQKQLETHSDTKPNDHYKDTTFKEIDLMNEFRLKNLKDKKIFDGYSHK